MAATPQFVATPRTAHVKLTNASGTTAQTLLTMGASGGLVEGLFVTSNDTASRFVTLLLSDGSTDVLIDSVAIAAAAVSVPVQRVNLLDVLRQSWLDPNNVKWTLAAGRMLKVRMESAVTASYETAVIANYGEF